MHACIIFIYISFMANLRFFGATFFKSFVDFFFSLHIKVKYLYIRKYTTAMDFCGDRPAGALNRKKH